ncbi:MAG: PRC-barrel domain-containing protein [Gemmatimonadota bacterium]
MLHKAKALKGRQLIATDGAIGSVADFYFDDQFWAIRYLVAETGSWLTGRAVLLSPYAVDSVSADGKEIVTALSRKQIEASPSIESNKPVSKQFEESYYGYYGWPSYYGGPLMWGSYPSISRDPEYWAAPEPGKNSWDPHLRSVREVTGYHILATEGEIGHVSDFIIDDESWAIRYLVVDSSNWLPGKKVLVSSDWIEKVSWETATVSVRLTREAIKSAPDYVEEALLEREYETRLHGHYQRPGYWQAEQGVVDPTR